MFQYAGRFCNDLFRFPLGGYTGMIIGVILIAVLIYFVVRKSGRPGDFPESPQELLKKRYINGEISKEEYLEMKETLGR